MPEGDFMRDADEPVVGMDEEKPVIGKIVQLAEASAEIQLGPRSAAAPTLAVGRVKDVGWGIFLGLLLAVTSLLIGGLIWWLFLYR